MRINDLALSRQRNAEHFQYQTEFKTQVENSTALALGIESQYNNYLPKYNEESEALVYVSKSSHTDLLFIADNYRDSIFRGLCDTVKAACYHFIPAKAEAAKKLMIIFDTYGNISVEAYDEETAKLTSLVNDLLVNHSSEINLLGVTEWVDELKASNIRFEDIKSNRYSEESAKTILRMKQVRKETDQMYQDMINRINAQILLNGETNYKDFVIALNQRIENAKNVMVKRKGKNGEKEGGTEETI
jgi:hypothetical protein